MASGRGRELLNQPEPVSAFCLSSDRRSLITAMRFKPKIYLWDFSGDGSPSPLDAPGWVIAVGLTGSNDDPSIVALSKDGQLWRWNAKDRQVQSKL